jgi:hypothetical protein
MTMHIELVENELPKAQIRVIGVAETPSTT